MVSSLRSTFPSAPWFLGGDSCRYLPSHRACVSLRFSGNPSSNPLAVRPPARCLDHQREPDCWFHRSDGPFGACLRLMLSAGFRGGEVWSERALPVPILVPLEPFDPFGPSLSTIFGLLTLTTVQPHVRFR